MNRFFASMYRLDQGFDAEAKLIDEFLSSKEYGSEFRSMWLWAMNRKILGAW